MIRKRKDSPPEPGRGIDGTEGEDYGRKYVKDPWGYGGASTKGGSEGNGHEPANERSYAGAYTENESGLTNVEEIQFYGGTRDIMADVEANSRPRGDDNYGFDAPGPIKAGINRSQSDGTKKGGAR